MVTYKRDDAGGSGDHPAAVDVDKVDLGAVGGESTNAVESIRLHQPGGGGGETESAPAVQDDPPSRLPMLFERAAHSWWNPRFDSAILEAQYRDSSFRQTCHRFQYALLYAILSGLAWTAYLLVYLDGWPALVPGAIATLTSIALLGLSFTRFYRRLILPSAVLLTLTLAACCLLPFAFQHRVVSPIGTFSSSLCLLLLLYTLVPLPLHLCTPLAILYSVAYEALTALSLPPLTATHVVGRLLLHLAVHVIGVHLFIMTEVRNRTTFLKVGQSIMSRHDLEIEKQLKRKMIHSLMPPKVAEEVMKSRGEDSKDEEGGACGGGSGGGGPTTRLSGGQLKFRNFHMNKMDDVTILFADIVGFTKMSSNKSAELLVSLLNDLFGRFDKLCTRHGCEKISTLGDCYYCVSGCPEPRADHARCSVEMGLGMCRAIRQFDDDHNEQVNMRVGVHTGTVLCGLVGTRRFKFDVWSHDVTLANTMESDGRPGLVHISDSTYQLLRGEYTVEPGESVEDIRKHMTLIEQYNLETQKYVIQAVKEEVTIKTWFITGRRSAAPPSADGNISSLPPDDATADNSISAPQDNAIAPPSSVNEDSNSFSMTMVPGTNGLSPAVLLSKREELTASIEDLAGEKSDVTVKTALMAQLQTHQQLRHQTDRQLVQCMRADPKTHEYLYEPPINPLTLAFLSPPYEGRYRRHAAATPPPAAHPTCASALYGALSDVIVASVVLAAVSFGGLTTTRRTWPVGAVVVVAAFLQGVLLVCQVTPVASRVLLGWRVRHAVGAVAVGLPTAVAVATLALGGGGATPDRFMHALLVASLLHFANYSLLTSWLKSALAAVAVVVVVVCVALGIFDGGGGVAPPPFGDAGNATTAMPTVDAALAHFRHELLLDLLLLLLLLAFLNREAEVGTRLGFHGDQRAAVDHARMHEEKSQADWLLHNIIPRHVADVLKRTSQYCQNHFDVGVLFAKVVNYDDFYDESYEGGREYLRVLNELMGDFEDLFDQARFRDVEKIKTIGACLMAASGLNPETRRLNRDADAHLYALVDFATELLHKLDAFNADILNFDFKMAIGFNFGEVTSGVIGTTKLLYDIWGDTVNISSRMYSTGVAGRVQMTEDSAEKLKSKFEFEYRGKTFVKGKGDMKTYLLVKKIASWD